MIQARELTKLFGSNIAVNSLSFDVQPGVVTGLLGPNGAGKSTTMRMILGLDRPTSGSVNIDGISYADLEHPMREVGALLDAKAIDGRRSAYQHLRWLAIAGRIPRRRIDEVLAAVGLEDVATRKIKDFSLGMFQRLGIAAALLGDPRVLVLDEPVNGLDPEGIRWIRTLMRKLASEGRTVLVSSHLMSEMEKTADHVIVIGRGKLVADMPVSQFVKGEGPDNVRVVTPDAQRLTELLTTEGARVQVIDSNTALQVSGLTNVRIAELAAQNQILLHELTPERQSLEARFMELTHDSVDFKSLQDDESNAHQVKDDN